MSEQPAQDSGRDADLYARVVEANANHTTIGTNGLYTEIVITGDHGVTVNDRKVPLESHRLFAFNALVMAGQPVTAPELLEFGFDPNTPPSRLKVALNGLARALKKAAGYEVIAIADLPGGEKVYGMTPVSLHDMRPGNSRTKRLSSNRAERQSRDERVDTILGLSREYGERPAVSKKVNEYRKSARLPKASLLAADHLGFYARQFPVLSAEQEVELFEQIEAGMPAKYPLPELSLIHI